MSRRPPRELQASAGSSKPRSSNHKAISTGSDTDNDTGSSRNSISSSSPSPPPAPLPLAPERARPRRRARARPLSETTAIPRQSIASTYPSDLPPFEDSPLALPPPPIGDASAGRSLSASLSPTPNGRQYNPRSSYDAQFSPDSPPLSEPQDAISSRDNRRQRQRVELPLRSDALSRSSQLPRLDGQSAVVVRQSSRQPQNHVEYEHKKYGGHDRRDRPYQRDQRERRDFREHRGHRDSQDRQDYRDEADNDLAGLSSSAWKAPLLFVGSVAAATFCIDRFWPKGITYGEKEAWEVQEEVLHRHHDRDGQQRMDRGADATRMIPNGSRRIVERERIDERRLDDRRIRDRKRVQERAEEVANEQRPRGNTRRREKAVIVDEQDDSRYGKQYTDRLPVSRDSLRKPATARALREDALNPQYSRNTRAIQDDAFDGDESFRHLRERRARARVGPPSRSAWDATAMQGAAVATAVDEDDRLRRRRLNGADGSIYYEHNSRDWQLDRRDRLPRDAYGEDDPRRSLYSHAHGNGRFLLDTSNADADPYATSRGWPRKNSLAPDRDPETEGWLPVDRTRRQHTQRQRRDHADADYRDPGTSQPKDGRTAATAAATTAVAAGATVAAINGRQDRQHRQDRLQNYRYDEDRSFSPPPRLNRFPIAYTVDAPLRQPEPLSYAQLANEEPVSKGPKVSRGRYKQPLDDYDSESNAPSTIFKPPSRVTSRGGEQTPVDDHSDDDDDLIEVIEESAPKRRASRQKQSSRLSPQPPPPLITRSSPSTTGARAPAPVLLSDSDNSDGAGHMRRHPKKGRNGLPPRTSLSPKSNPVVSDADVTTDNEARSHRNEVLTDSDSLAYSDSEVSDQPSARRFSEKSLHVYAKTAPKTHLRRVNEPDSVFMTGGAGLASSNHSETSDSSSRGTSPPQDRRSRHRPAAEKSSGSEDSDSDARYSRSPRRARPDSETSKVDKSLVPGPGNLDQQSDWDRNSVRSTQSKQSLGSTDSDSHRRSAPYAVPSPPPIGSAAGGKRKPSIAYSDDSGRSPSPPSRVTRAATMAGASYLSEDMSRPSDTSSLRDRYQSGGRSRGPASSFVSDSLRSVSLRSSRFRSQGSLHRKSGSSGNDSSTRSSSRSRSRSPNRTPHYRSPRPPRSSTSTALSKGGSDSEPDARSSWGHSANGSTDYVGRSEVSRRSRQGATQGHDHFSYKSFSHKSRENSDSGTESKKSSTESDNDGRLQRSSNAGSVSASNKRSRASVLESASDSDSDRNTVRHSTTSSPTTRTRSEAAAEVRVRARQIAIDREQAREARAQKDRQSDWDSLRMHDKAAI
ncbi:MAG: hypothetical protein SEPTF4163_004884 [Sporothrix epigloea]